MCNYLQIDTDNKYTLEHIIKKLQKQTPQLLLGLTNQDIQQQTIEYFDQKLQAIKHSKYYQQNKETYQADIQKLEQNISLVKKALQIV